LNLALDRIIINPTMSISENYRPKGSPIAQRISQSLNEETSKEVRNYEKRKKLLEEVRKVPAETYANLGISDLLKDMQVTVWQGGTVNETDVEYKVNETTIKGTFFQGTIRGCLEFHYDTAKHETRSWLQTEQYGEPITPIEHTEHSAEIFTEALSLRINVITRILVDLDKSDDSNTTTETYLFVGSNRGSREASSANIPVNQESDEEVLEKLMDFLVEDAKARISSGELPVAVAAARGQERIRETLKFAAAKKIKVIDRRGK
jgi:hypothetical protein